MRAIPPCVVCAMLLLGLTATDSLADPSIVADLDSSATNGPDTLQAEVGDTVLVRVWITDSADSLVGFGITFGDTSGTLAWAEDDTDAAYTVPAGWMAIPVVVDEIGRLLLQSHDFSFSAPLHMPRQVAQLKFVAVLPESCVVFSWDTDDSGWQNWEFDIGEFAGFEGAVVCVAGPGDGGGDEGEGDEDDAPSAGPYPCEPDLIEVMFAWDSRVRLRDGIPVDLESDATTGLDSILNALDWYSWRRLSGVAEEVLDEIHETAEQNLGKPVYNLNNIYRVRVPMEADVWELAADLAELPGIVRATPVPLMPELPYPPDFEPVQGYLDAADSLPSGVDAEYAWLLPGGNGDSVIVCDVEACWNYNHIDLSKAPGSQVNPNAICDRSVYSYSSMHGTGSLGVLVSDPNGWGTTGICYASSLMTSGVQIQEEGGDTVWNPAAAIAIATANLRPGDVLLVEQQWSLDPLQLKIPIEWYSDSSTIQTENPVYVAVVNAVGNGINVVEPGGNGNDDTDQLTWLENSGAIIVGAGEADPENDRRRWSESSYGTRFDLQGWGENIVTTGRGDLYGGGPSDTAYSGSANGTSGASAIVAGAVADLVGFWKRNISPEPPSTDSVRSLLRQTGTPQVPGAQQNVGPRPDLRRAIGELIETGIRRPRESPQQPVSLKIAPRPLNGVASILLEIPEDGPVRVELFSPTGQLVGVLFDGTASRGKHGLEWDGRDGHGRPVGPGVYLCRLVAGRASATEKVVVIR